MRTPTFRIDNKPWLEKDISTAKCAQLRLGVSEAAGQQEMQQLLDASLARIKHLKDELKSQQGNPSTPAPLRRGTVLDLDTPSQAWSVQKMPKKYRYRKTQYEPYKNMNTCTWTETQ